MHTKNSERPLLDSTELKDEIEESIKGAELKIISLEKAQKENKIGGSEVVISSTCRQLGAIISNVKELATIIQPNTTLHAYALQAQEKCKALDTRLQLVSKIITSQLKQSYMEYSEGSENAIDNGKLTQIQAIHEQFTNAKDLEAVLEDRQRELEIIETKLMDLHTITTNMHILVIERGCVIDNIAEEIQSAKINIEKGVKEVKMTDNRRRKPFCFLVYLIILVVVLVIVINNFLYLDKLMKKVQNKI